MAAKPHQLTDSGARGENGTSEEERDLELAPETGLTAGTGMGPMAAKPGKATPTFDPAGP